VGVGVLFPVILNAEGMKNLGKGFSKPEPGPSLRSGRQPEPGPSLTLRMTEIQAHRRRSGRQAMDFPVKLTFLPLRNTIACGIFFSQL
jgi:hypothetical protein